MLVFTYIWTRVIYKPFHAQNAIFILSYVARGDGNNSSDMFLVATSQVVHAEYHTQLAKTSSTRSSISQLESIFMFII